MAKIFLVCMLAVSGLMSSLADRDINEGDMNVKVDGQSAEFIIQKSNGNRATLTFEHIKELNADGKPVGETGKNSKNKDASQHFKCKTGDGLKTEYQNIGVHSMQCNAKIPGPKADLTVNIYIFKGAGAIATANEEVIIVKKGTVKFDILIAGWSFCGGSDGVSCRVGSNQQVGKYLELCLKVAGRGEAKESNKKSGKGKGMKTFDFGAGFTTLSGEVKTDGVWQDMLENYPKVEKKGSKTYVKFRFPRFTKELFYDPTFDMSTTAPGGGAALAKGHMALISLCALLVIIKLIA